MSEPIELVDTIHIQIDQSQADILDWYLRSLSQSQATMGCRGAGKSADIRAILFCAAISSRKQILYASQSTGNSTDQYEKLKTNECVREFLYYGPDREPYTTDPTPRIRFENGSEIIFWSMQEKNTKRGLHPNLIIVDEAQSISQEAWSKVLYPMRVRFGGGARILVFGTVPETDGHWWWEYHQKGLEFPNPSGVKSHVMSADKAMSFKGIAGKQLLAEMESTMAKEDFQAEIMLIPGGRGEAFLNAANIDGCVLAYNHNPQSLENGTLMILDPALGKQDPTAYQIWDLTGNCIISHSMPKDIKDTEQIEELVSMAKKWKSLCVVESNSTAYMTYLGSLKLLMPHGVMDIPMRAIATNQGDAKNALYKQFSLFMEQKRIRFNPECKELVRQLKSLRDYKTPSGQLQIKPPGKLHDDEASCALIASEALNRGWKPVLHDRNPLMGLL